MFPWAVFGLIAVGGITTSAESAAVGSSFLPAVSSAVPNATAFFPLTSLSSSGSQIVSQGGQQNLGGSVNGTASWIADSVFGYVLDCSSKRYNSIILDPVSIGTQGPFAVNVWFKSNITDNSGDLFAYILSTLNNASQSVSGGSNVYAPDSLQLMLPQSGNNRSGILRSVVKDFNDANANSTLDSDGNYNDDGALGPNAAFTNVSNGGWHMATLTTRTDVQHGYLLYIDGQVAAQLPPSGVPDEPTPVTSDGVVYYEDGGDPIYLDGNIYLCARTDGDSHRFFSGSVAQAGFYNEALNATNIQALYNAVTSSVALPTAPSAAPSAPTAATSISNMSTITGTVCVFPFVYDGANYSACISPDGSGSSYCRDTNGAFVACVNDTMLTTPAILDSANPISSPVSSPITSPANTAATSPATNTVPAAGLTSSSSDSARATEAGHSHGLSKGAIAGIVIGSLAGAALLMTLAAFVIIKVMGSGGHRRLQEAPSSKFLMHSSSMDQQMQMTRAADSKEAQSGLYNGPQSSDFNIKATS